MPWRVANLQHVADVLTIRQAAKTCGIGYEALRRRVDRGTIRSVKGHDGVRRIPRSELERAGLWPGAPAPGADVQLRAELAQARTQLQSALARARVEREARERAEAAAFEYRASQAVAEAQREELQRQLEEIAAAGPIRAYRLRRKLRGRNAS
jgi:excisionase family DNA binding protein